MLANTKIVQCVDFWAVFFCLMNRQNVTFSTTAQVSGFFTQLAHKVIHNICGQAEVILPGQTLTVFPRDTALRFRPNPLGRYALPAPNTLFRPVT
jgi:hypothetical protein